MHIKTYSLPELYNYLLQFHRKLVTEHGEYKATCIVDIKQFLDFLEVSAQEGGKQE